MDIITATPADIDTELARLQDLDSAAENAFRSVVKDLQILDADTYRSYLVKRTREELEADRATLLETRIALGAQMAPLEAEYGRRRWARYYRVDNSNGHVHTSTACRNTRTTTVFGWLPQVSGFEAEQIVELAGEFTCLTCFPTVREEIIKGRACRLETKSQRATREEREARDAEKAAKAAAAAVKGIKNPDGSPVVLSNASVVKTLIAAERRYVDTASRGVMFAKRVKRAEICRQLGQHVHEEIAAENAHELAETQRDCEMLLAALAHKLGTSVEEQRERFAVKVQKSFDRNWQYCV